MLKHLFKFPRTSVEWPEDALSAEQQSILSQAFQAEYAVLDDPQRIFDLCKAKADEGVVDAIYILGCFYEQGDGQQRYFSQAVECFKRCANHGHAEAQYQLGVIYAQDEFGEPNFALAYGYFKQATDGGVVQAQYNLAHCLDQGLGCLEEKASAFDHYQQAAEKGFAPASQNVAVMYYNGEGVDKDIVKAYGWTLYAAKQGVEEAKLAEAQMTQELSSQQIIEGKALLDQLLGLDTHSGTHSAH